MSSENWTKVANIKISTLNVGAWLSGLGAARQVAPAPRTLFGVTSVAFLKNWKKRNLENLKFEL